MTTLQGQTLTEALAHQGIPDEGIKEEALDLSVDELTAEDLQSVFIHLDSLFTANPSIRLSILAFLHSLLTNTSRALVSPVLVTSPLFQSYLDSLLLDTSPSLFSSEIRLFNALFSYAPAQITPHIPVLVTILARAGCWRPRHSSSVSKLATRRPPGRNAGGESLMQNTAPTGQLSYLMSRSEDPDFLDLGDDQDSSSPGSPAMLNLLGEALREQTPAPRSDLGWKILKGAGAKETWSPSSYLGTSSLHHHPMQRQSVQDSAEGILTPSQILAMSLLMDIHGIWPSNLVAFIRNPKGYLSNNKVICPYEGGWDIVWEDGEIPKRMSPLLKAFAFNPQALFADSVEELSANAIAGYAKMDPATAASIAHSLYRGYNSESQHGMISLLSGTSVIHQVSGRSKDRGGMLESPTEDSSSSSIGMSSSTSPANYSKSRGMMGVAGGYSSAKPIAIGGGRGNGTTDREVEVLRAQVEELKRELGHATDLKNLYLSHVNRLHRDSMTFASDEAERQLLFVSFKESKTRNAQLEAELANSKSERGRMQDTSQKSQATLRERYTKLREENRKGVAETSKARAELEDSNRVIDTLRRELANVKETQFKLENRLLEADPHIRNIEQYRSEISLYKEGQLRWDADVRKLKAQDETISLMSGRWRQMEQMVITSNKISQKLTEREREMSDLLADRYETIRRLRMANEKSARPAETAPPESRLGDGLKTLWTEARRRISELERENLDLHVRVEQLDFAARSSSSGGQESSLVS